MNWFRKLLCHLEIHRWRYIPNDHGGKPMRRICVDCYQREGWNYDEAREHGRIVWEELK